MPRVCGAKLSWRERAGGARRADAAIGQAAWVLIAAAVLTAVFAPLTGWLYGRPR